jgi:hypothetical protein
MNTEHPPLIALPDSLSDEAAVTLLQCLRDITRALEQHYAAQLQRHHHRPDQRQQTLWPPSDPPF